MSLALFALFLPSCDNVDRTEDWPEGAAADAEIPGDGEIDVEIPGAPDGSVPSLADAATFREPASVAKSLDADGDGWHVGEDCDDDHPFVFPGAPEVCDGVDNDCDPATSEDGTAWHRSTRGLWTDLTPTLGAGSPASAAFATVTGGEVYLCSGAWYAALWTSRGASVLGPAGSAATSLETDGSIGGIAVLGNRTHATVTGLTIHGTPSGMWGFLSASAGGGMVCSTEYGTKLTLQDVVLEDVGYPNGIWIGAGLYAEGPCRVEVYDSIIRDNFANFGAGIGLVWGADLRLQNSVVYGNDAYFSGGGVAVDGEASMTMVDSLLVWNRAGYMGGGVQVAGGSTFTCRRSRSGPFGIAVNAVVPVTLPFPGPYESGGGVAIYAGSAEPGTTTFRSEACHMGEDRQDNWPDDILLSGSGTSLTGLGDSTTITCTDAGC